MHVQYTIYVCDDSMPHTQHRRLDAPATPIVSNYHRAYDTCNGACCRSSIYLRLDQP